VPLAPEVEPLVPEVVLPLAPELAPEAFWPLLPED
jgi:hypothetical protein